MPDRRIFSGGASLNLVGLAQSYGLPAPPRTSKSSSAAAASAAAGTVEVRNAYICISLQQFNSLLLAQAVLLLLLLLQPVEVVISATHTSCATTVHYTMYSTQTSYYV
jgi:hypothetical protein